MEVARRRALLPGLASGLIIHQEDLPVPSFCTRMKRLCSDRLWRIEFCNTNTLLQLSELLCRSGEVPASVWAGFDSRHLG
jgi:hypothetical protein